MGGTCPEFEPYLDDLLENQDFSRCQEFVNQKRFDWEQEASPDFDPVEVVDEDVPFSPELSSAIEKLARDGEKIASRYRRKGIVPNARLKAVFLSHQKACQKDSEPGERRVASILVASRISLP